MTDPMGDYPPGLESRSMSRRDGKVYIEEHWNIDTPGCPMIRSPWHPQHPEGSRYVRIVEMSEAEYEAVLGSLEVGEQPRWITEKKE